MTDLERMARAIYGAAFENLYGGKKPEPGWCWDKAGPVQRAFATKQAFAALEALMEPSPAAFRAWVAAGYDGNPDEIVPVTGSGQGDYQETEAWAQLAADLRLAYRHQAMIRHILDQGRS